VPEVAFLLYNSLAPRTRRTHSKIVATYEFFCRQHYYAPYPASFRTISHWLAHLLSSLKPATTKCYLGALKSFHIRTSRSTSAFQDDRLNLIIKGGKRVYGEGSKAIRYPITSDILLRIVREIADDEDGINLKVALCVGFAAFLQSGEFTWDTWSPDSHRLHLSHKHIVFQRNGSVILTLPASKTDQSHSGTEIFLARSPRSPICSISALRSLFRRYPAPLSAPLFLRQFGQPFSESFFVLPMHNLLLNTGISPFGYSGHSLRKGAAVTADMNGISRSNIKLLGR
jgi:hypothetical protein